MLNAGLWEVNRETFIDLMGVRILHIENSGRIVKVAEAATVPAGEPTVNLENSFSIEGKLETEVPSDLGIKEMIAQYFPNNTEKALAVFNCESNLNSKRHSEVDLMADGRAFSIGLTQQNLTVTKLDGVDCSKAFIGRNRHAKVIDEQLYQKCVKLAENPKISLETAVIKSGNGNNFNAWDWCNNKTN